MDTVVTTERWIEIDAPDQTKVFTRGPVPVYLRVDDSHELPVVVGDRDCKPIARFANVGDAAVFIIGRTLTQQTVCVPAPIAEAVARQRPRT